VVKGHNAKEGCYPENVEERENGQDRDSRGETWETRGRMTQTLQRKERALSYNGLYSNVYAYIAMRQISPDEKTAVSLIVQCAPTDTPVACRWVRGWIAVNIQVLRACL